MAIRVLMVTDAEGSYTESGERFGLTELVKALEEGDCAVTKAHRWNSNMLHTAGAQITGFKFDNAQHFNPDDYDEVWLMGFASSNPVGPYQDPQGFGLSNTEVQVLGTFMNDGGGVFATGDHDDLGADLCASVPRVRSMRRWTADYSWWQQVSGGADPDSVVPDTAKSPPPIGRYRLDTLMKGHNAHYEFQDQSDDVPQEIDPVMHVIRQHVTHVAGGTIAFMQKAPHPLLCTSSGIIDVLPDHMHEGRCEVPQDLTKTFTAAGRSHSEYPETSTGVRVSPEVVAWGTVPGRKYDASFDDPTEDIRDSNTNVNADYFPVIVAYNGHRAKVGRVVVDSTFHHFVNINVTGVKSEFSSEPNPVDAIKASGFLASPEGEAQYQRIKAYWRNIAHWICRPGTLKLVAWKAFMHTALDPRLKQTMPMGDISRVPLPYLTRYGAAAWTLMAGRLPPCTVYSMVVDIAIPDPLSYLLSYAAYIRLTLPDPPPIERIRKDLAVDKLELVRCALGAVMLELRQAVGKQAARTDRLSDITPARGIAMVQRAAHVGVQRGLAEQAARMQRTLTALQKAIELGGKSGGSEAPLRS